MRTIAATNEFHVAPEYHAGRLMAVCQHVQDLTAPDVGRSYSDNYFRAACQSPRSILPRIVTVARSRLRQIERGDQRRDVENLLVRLFQQFKNDMPSAGQAVSRSQFQLGYFHQLADLPSKEGYGGKRYLTTSGVVVRSLGEQLIADVLSQMGVSFSYEEDLEVLDPTKESGKAIIQPDFTIRTAASERVLFIEHCGMIGVESYDRQWSYKRRCYKNLGASQIEELLTGMKPDRYALCRTLPEHVRSARVCRERLVEAYTLTIGPLPSSVEADVPF